MTGTPDPGEKKASSLRLDYGLGEMRIARINLPACLLAGGSVGDGSAAAQAHEALHGGTRAAVLRSVGVEHPLKCLGIEAGLIRYVPHQYRRYSIALGEGTFEEYLQGFSAKTRATLRRKVRRLSQAAGGLACVEHRTREEVRAFLEEAGELSRLTYQERLLGKGLPADPCYREEMLRLADEDRVRAYLLRVGPRPAAYLLCPVREGRVLYEHLGYDPELAGLSPGTVLQYLALERLFAERRDWTFDFTEGEGEHKEFWARSHEQCADVYYLRASPGNALLVAAHLALSSASRGAARLLGRVGLKARLKRLIRARA